MWKKTENGEAVVPHAIEVSGSNVIVRRMFEYVEATEDKPEHYEYEEWQMTKDQYQVYRTLEKQINEQDDALIELAYLFAEQDDALVELAEMIDGGE